MAGGVASRRGSSTGRRGELLTSIREITAILVSWRDEEDARRAIESLAAARRWMADGGLTVSLVVVDNGGGTVDRRAVETIWPGATVLVNTANVGFGPAVNQAARAAAGDVLLLVNPDARAEGEPYGEIARAFESREDVVAVAPRLVDEESAAADVERPRRLAPPDREDQFTFQLRTLPRLEDDARELLLLDHLAPNSRSRRMRRYADRDPEAPAEVEQPAAAVLAVRADVFREIGGFDEAFVPAWFEDVDLCARLRKRGAILYWPAARFSHRGGAASERLGYANFLPIYYRNAIRYRRRHYSWPAQLAYRGLLLGGMLLRLGALPFRRPARPRRESAWAYLRVLGVSLAPLRTEN